MLEITIIAIFAAFSLASAAFQFRGLILCDSLWKFDRFGLLPNYSFFAPAPLMIDFRIVYKMESSGVDRQWREVQIYENIGLVKMLWNPFKYYNKGAIDLCMGLTQEFANLRSEDRAFIQISSYYLWIMRIIQTQPEFINFNPQQFQFFVLASRQLGGERKSTLVFESYIHNHEPSYAD